MSQPSLTQHIAAGSSEPLSRNQKLQQDQTQHHPGLQILGAHTGLALNVTNLERLEAQHDSWDLRR